MIWRGQIIGYRLLSRRRKITVGPSKRATFATPALEGKSKFLLLQPRRDGYVLHLASAFKGELTLGGVSTSVADIASRDVDLARGDKAKLIFADGSDLRIELRWVDPPDRIARPRIRDPQMVQITVGTSIVLGALAILLNVMWEKTEPKPPLALDAQRVAKIEAPAAIEFEKKEIKKQKEEQAEKSTEKEGTDQARQGEGRPHRPQRRHPQGHRHPQGEGRHPSGEGPEGRHPQHHRPRQGAWLRALQAVRAEQRRRAGDGRHGRRQDGRRARRGGPHHQRVGPRRRRHRLRAHLRGRQPRHRRARHPRPRPRTEARRARRARGVGRPRDGRRRHRRLAVEGAGLQGGQGPLRGREVLLREGAPAQDARSPATSTSSG